MSVDVAFGLPWLQPGEHVPCIDEADLFNLAAHPTRDEDFQLIVADAKAICEPCHVRTDCAAWALERRQEKGVWGGTSDADRAEIRQRLGMKAPRIDRPPQTRDCTRPELERARDWAAMLRDGRATVASLAEGRGVKVDTVTRILNRAGYTQSGYPREQAAS